MFYYVKRDPLNPGEKFLKIRQILFEKNFKEFPPEMISKIQSYFSPLDYGIFSSSNGLRKYAIWVYVEKYFNIVILFRITPVPEPGENCGQGPVAMFKYFSS